jgi:hypothetical protein
MQRYRGEHTPQCAAPRRPQSRKRSERDRQGTHRRRFERHENQDDPTTKSYTMTNPNTIPRPNRFEVRVTADSHFGWLRTCLSLENSMMSELCTAMC